MTCTIRLRYLLTALLVVAALASSAAPTRRTVTLAFRPNGSALDATYLDNAERLQEMSAIVDNIRATRGEHLVAVELLTYATPGPNGLSEALASRREATLTQFLRRRYAVPATLIRRAAQPQSLSAPGGTIVFVTESDAQVEHEAVQYVGTQRGASAATTATAQRVGTGHGASATTTATVSQPVGTQHGASAAAVTPPVATGSTPQAAPMRQATLADESPEPNALSRYSLSTNAIEWALFQANLNAEMAVSDHVSVMLNASYGALDWFSERVKFRRLRFEAAARYWFGVADATRPRFFAGVHGGLCWYDYAFGGDTRYQDHNGDTPGWGGGIDIGLRYPLSRDGQWALDFQVGGGAWSLKYDDFDDTEGGDRQLTGQCKRTWWGPDQVAVSLVYTFHSNKRSR